MFTIWIREKGAPLRSITIDKREITIGRLPDNDVILLKGRISKNHARIVLVGDLITITDLNSLNGTTVNNKKVTDATVIQATDEIRIGDFILTLSEPPAEASTQPRLSASPNRAQSLPATADGATQLDDSLARAAGIGQIPNDGNKK